jgi:hypothetical protein
MTMLEAFGDMAIVMTTINIRGGKNDRDDNAEVQKMNDHDDVEDND